MGLKLGDILKVALFAGAIALGGAFLVPSLAAGYSSIYVYAAVQAGIAAAVFTLSQLLAPTVEQGTAASVTTVRSAVAPAQWIIGRARTGGMLAFAADKLVENQSDIPNPGTQPTEDAEDGPTVPMYYGPEHNK